MCGRFYVDDETEQEIERIARRIDERMQRERGEETRYFTKTDIYPTQVASVLHCDEDRLKITPQKWGFSFPNSKSPIINARQETITSNRVFAPNITSRRCIIPARGFYEWNKSKEKYSFEAENKKPILLAGVYQLFQNIPCFVIITTKPNESVEKIHDRMPLILREEEAHAWLTDCSESLNILKKIPDKLLTFCEFEQERLPI